MKQADQLRAGSTFEDNGVPFLILKGERFQSTSGKRQRAPEIKFRVKDLITGKVNDITVKANDMMNDIILERSQMQFLYEMDGNTVTASGIGDLNTTWEVERVADYGGDGKADILLRNSSTGDLFLPEMLAAANAMKAGLEILKPHLTEGSGQSKGGVVIGTGKGDLHDIG